MLLTRLPVGWLLAGAGPPPGRCVWAYPVIGGVVGGLGALVYAMGWRAGVGPALAAIWSLGAMAVVTGGLHEDGLADTADGFGGGRTRERKLDIMRDSRIGSYGVLALLLALSARAASLAVIEQPARVAAALIAAASLGRGGIGVLLLALRPARDDGLGVMLGDVDKVRAALGPVLAAALAFALLPAGLAAGAVGASLLIALALAALARRQIGGYTGDVLGACVVATECGVLTLLAAR